MSIGKNEGMGIDVTFVYLLDGMALITKSFY